MSGPQSDKARAYLLQHPAATPYEVAAGSGCSARTARRVVRRQKAHDAWLRGHPGRASLVSDMDSAIFFGAPERQQAIMRGFGVRVGFDYGVADGDRSMKAEIDECGRVAFTDITDQPDVAPGGVVGDGWKHVIVVSDMHCGHSVGLTPPGRWQGEDVDIQREMWEFFEREVRAHGPYHACFNTGDNIDGRGSKSGGTELITNDLLDQTDIATQCLLAIPTDKFYMVYGTPYHVSVEGTDMERQIADNLRLHGKEVTISGHEWIDVNGCVFDIKHKVGGSGSPQGRHTAIAKARLWNDLWSLRSMAPRADVFCRGHVHYHVDCGGIRNGRPWRAMTLPALQGPGGKFGIRQCEGEVNFGFVVFHVSPEGKFTWDVHEFQPKAGMPIARIL